jgi:hypothetical protein
VDPDRLLPRQPVPGGQERHPRLVDDLLGAVVSAKPFDEMPTTSRPVPASASR